MNFVRRYNPFAGRQNTVQSAYVNAASRTPEPDQSDAFTRFFRETMAVGESSAPNVPGSKTGSENKGGTFHVPPGYYPPTAAPSAKVLADPLAILPGLQKIDMQTATRPSQIVGQPSSPKHLAPKCLAPNQIQMGHGMGIRPAVGRNIRNVAAAPSAPLPQITNRDCTPQPHLPALQVYFQSSKF